MAFVRTEMRTMHPIILHDSKSKSRSADVCKTLMALQHGNAQKCHETDKRQTIKSLDSRHKKSMCCKSQRTNIQTKASF